MKDKILEYRKKHAISQNKMAKMCGVSPVTITRLEHGGKPSPIVEGKINRIIQEDK